MDKAAAQRSGRLRQFWRDLSVFVAVYLSVVTLVGFAIFFPISLLLRMVMPQASVFLAWGIGYVLVAVALIWRWRTHGLSPRHVDPARQMRFRWGHVLLAFFNICTLAIYAQAWIGASPTLPVVQLIARISLTLLTLSPIALVAGLAMVLSAKGTAPAFADTLPDAQDTDPEPNAPMRVASAKWPHEAEPTASRPSLLLVLAGLVVSSVPLYLAAVFGALALSHQHDLLKDTVLPIAISAYAAYVATAMGMWAMRMRAAKWVAWAPVILLAVIGPARQMVGMLLR